MNSIFEAPRCDDCKLNFRTIPILDVHMKLVHKETEYERIERTLNAKYAVQQSQNPNQQVNKNQMTLTAIKNYICTECGVVFSTLNDQRVHEEEHHNIKEESILKIPEQVDQNPKSLQITIQPQEGWLSKSLPNLEDLLATIPSNKLVSKEDEMKSQEDFKDIMCKVKTVKVINHHEIKSTLKCKKCKFNTISKESLKIHVKNVHEPIVLSCDQ